MKCSIKDIFILIFILLIVAISVIGKHNFEHAKKLKIQLSILIFSVAALSGPLFFTQTFFHNIPMNASIKSEPESSRLKRIFIGVSGTIDGSQIDRPTVNFTLDKAFYNFNGRFRNTTQWNRFDDRSSTDYEWNWPSCLFMSGKFCLALSNVFQLEGYIKTNSRFSSSSGTYLTYKLIDVNVRVKDGSEIPDWSQRILHKYKRDINKHAWIRESLWKSSCRNQSIFVTPLLGKVLISNF